MSTQFWIRATTLSNRILCGICLTIGLHYLLFQILLFLNIALFFCQPGSWIIDSNLMVFRLKFLPQLGLSAARYCIWALLAISWQKLSNYSASTSLQIHYFQSTISRNDIANKSCPKKHLLNGVSDLSVDSWYLSINVTYKGDSNIVNLWPVYLDLSRTAAKYCLLELQSSWAINEVVYYTRFHGSWME